MDDKTRDFCIDAGEYIRSFSINRELLRRIDGPSKAQFDTLIELDFFCNSFAAATLKLAAESFPNEALPLRRGLLEGQLKFLYLFIHKGGFDNACWEYMHCLPHLSLETQVRKLHQRRKELTASKLLAAEQKEPLLKEIGERLAELYSSLQHNKKVFKWPKGRPNPLTDSKNIRKRWETDTLLREVNASGQLLRFPIHDLYSLSSAVHHFAYEVFPKGLADVVTDKTRILATSSDSASLIRECVLFPAYRFFVLSSRVSNAKNLQLDSEYLRLIRRASSVGVVIPPECMGPYNVIGVDGNKVTVRLADID
jgi:hypothetical protein